MGKRESSGRVWLSKEVAAYLGCVPDTVRAMVRKGYLEPAHITPSGVSVFMRDEIEAHGEKLRLKARILANVDAAVGLPQASCRVVNIREQQGELPLMEKA